VIAAAQALLSKRLPPMLHANEDSGLRFAQNSSDVRTSAIVLSCGLNQQAAGLRLSI
jgi:hypothetical protein